MFVRQVTKKLAGLAAGTAAWATSVANERGEVLNTVLTTSESLDALGPLATGLVDRYRRAGQQPPAALYTDRDCCRIGAGRSRLQELFGAWPGLVVRLDAWHYMRRFALGLTSPSHPLYGTFMARLSACLLEWDAGDVAQLEGAKLAQLREDGVAEPTAHAARLAISRSELARHCRRRTAGVQATVDRIQRLLLELADATDVIGTPLLNVDEMAAIWEEQRRHVVCLQDPEEAACPPLYVQTGTSRMGGVTLPVFRCARGTTGLESYHLHLCRFIPGKKPRRIRRAIEIAEHQLNDLPSIVSSPCTFHILTTCRSLF